MALSAFVDPKQPPDDEDLATMLGAAAKRYAEGTGLRVEVRKPGDLGAVRMLLAAKMGT